MKTRSMTVAQAVVEFLSKQYVVDSIGGVDHRERLIPGMFGIFGHGNVAGRSEERRVGKECPV